MKEFSNIDREDLPSLQRYIQVGLMEPRNREAKMQKKKKTESVPGMATGHKCGEGGTGEGRHDGGAEVAHGHADQPEADEGSSDEDDDYAPPESGSSSSSSSSS
ncbi:unnamed protein product, partial [Discosporangium mesarthrocarpum]